MTTVLVTGGAGFIGSHTVDALVERGYAVRILDSLQDRVHGGSPPDWINPAAELIVGDVREESVLAAALRGADLVLHLAAYQDYMTDFSTFVHVNTVSSARILEAAAATGTIRRVAFASSQSVAGEGLYVCERCAEVEVPSLDAQLIGRRADLPGNVFCTPAPRPVAQLERGRWELCCDRCCAQLRPVLIPEAVAAPSTAYAISKHAIELLAQQIGRRYGIETVCLRYTYVHGPRNSLRNAYSGIARRFAHAILRGEPLEIYEDGLQRRDYVSVSDVARANVLALEKHEAAGLVLNVGGDCAISVLELAAAMQRAFGADTGTSTLGTFRVGDTRHTVSDISRIRRLGWEPRVPLDETLAAFARWVCDQPVDSTVLPRANAAMREATVVRKAMA